MIGAHESTVRHWIHTGQLTASKFGTRIGYRIKRADYDAFLDRRTLTSVITAQLLRSTALAGESSSAPLRPGWAYQHDALHPH